MMRFRIKPLLPPVIRPKTVPVRTHVRITTTRGVQIVRYHLRTKPR